MCRSARERTELFPIIQKTPPRHVIQAFSASGVEKSTHVAEKYQHKVKSATREDSSTHCVRSE